MKDTKSKVMNYSTYKEEMLQQFYIYDTSMKMR